MQYFWGGGSNSSSSYYRAEGTADTYKHNKQTQAHAQKNSVIDGENT
jgi:hypothetical protein